MTHATACRRHVTRASLLAIVVLTLAWRATLVDAAIETAGYGNPHSHGGHHDHEGAEGHSDALTPAERAARIAEADAVLKPDTEVVCRKCGMHLTRRRAYMSPPASEKLVGMREEPALGQSGLVLTFQNAHKKVHGVATFSSADNVHVAAGASSKGTYFPGYTWAVASCSHCRAHVGWQFVKEEDPTTIKQRAAQQAAAAPAPPTPRPATSPKSKGGAKGKKKGRNLKALANLCQTFPQGWWTYEWCHQAHVRQFHREPDGTVTADWSLGKFDALGSRKFEAGGQSTQQRQPYFIHQFEGGQQCDETGKFRRSEVHFCCCHKDRGIHIESVTEPGLCTYRFTVCVPQLCDSHQDNGDANADSDRGAAADARVETSVTSTRSDGAAAPAGGATGASSSTGNSGTSFYGLLWGAVLVTDDQPMWWVDSVEPMTALSH